MSTHMSIHMSAYVHVYSNVYTHVYTHVHMAIRMSIYMSMRMSNNDRHGGGGDTEVLTVPTGGGAMLAERRAYTRLAEAVEVSKQ